MSISNPEFDARIARIMSGKGSSKSTLYVGLDEVYHISYPNRGRPSAARSAVSNALFPFMALFSLGCGVASFGIASWIRFRMMGYGVGTSEPNTEMAIQAGAALAVCLVLSMLLQMRSRPMKILMAMGAISTTFLFHNAVHFYPETFAQVFSPDWVEVVQATTKPLSVLWQGRSYTL